MSSFSRDYISSSIDESSWDSGETWPGRIEANLREALVPLDGIQSIIEIGCGTGYTTQELAEMFPEARVLGVDISEERVDKARRNNPHERVEYRNSPALEVSEKVATPAELVLAANSVSNLVNLALDGEEGLKYAKDFLDAALSASSDQAYLVMADGPVYLAAERDNDMWEAYEGRRVYDRGRHGETVFTPSHQFRKFLESSYMTASDSYTESSITS